MDTVLNFLKKYGLYILGAVLILGFAGYYLYYELYPVKTSNSMVSTASYSMPGISESDFEYHNLSTATALNDNDVHYPKDKYNRIVMEDGQVVFDPIVPFDSLDILGKEEFDRVIDGITPAISESQLQQLTTPWIVRQFQSNFFGSYWPEGGLDTCNGNKHCINRSHIRKGLFDTNCD